MNPEPSENSMKQSDSTKIPKEAQKMAAQLKDEYRTLLKNGFGASQSLKEEGKSMEALEEGIEDIFLLYAKVKMARALGVEHYFAAETGHVEMPDDYGKAN